jgi:peptide-methionine (S)-S-oxide reductase
VLLALMPLLSTPGLSTAQEEAENMPVANTLSKATFADGCFWCMEPRFDALPGVISTTSGYTGGSKPNPTYEEVSAGDTSHAEAVEVVYDPAKISYPELLRAF